MKEKHEDHRNSASSQSINNSPRRYCMVSHHSDLHLDCVGLVGIGYPTFSKLV